MKPVLGETAVASSILSQSVWVATSFRTHHDKHWERAQVLEERCAQILLTHFSLNPAITPPRYRPMQFETPPYPTFVTHERHDSAAILEKMVIRRATPRKKMTSTRPAPPNHRNRPSKSAALIETRKPLNVKTPNRNKS